MITNTKQRAIRAGGWRLARRMIKPLPIAGSIVALGLALYEIKKKGLLRGVINAGLEVTPFVGAAKSVVEIFTGDLIPDQKSKSLTALK